jgi:hypothetical protein
MQRWQPRERMQNGLRGVGLALVLACVLAPPTVAEPAPTKPGERSRALSPFDRALYAQLLERHTRISDDVVGTRVDYRALRSDPDWKRLALELRSARPSLLDRDGRLAFWINAYNILTIDLVLEHYPVDSIRDIGSFLFPVWNRDVATIEGRSVSLGEIEHEILRPMGEPRIHAAIVCASTSCPPLARTPFRAERIDADLDEAMRRWLSSEAKGVAIDRDAKRVRLSAIFDWFEEDFEASGGVLSTVAGYVDPASADWLRGPGRDARIRYLDYDWALNDVRR